MRRRRRSCSGSRCRLAAPPLPTPRPGSSSRWVGGVCLGGGGCWACRLSCPATCVLGGNARLLLFAAMAGCCSPDYIPASPPASLAPHRAHRAPLQAKFGEEGKAGFFAIASAPGADKENGVVELLVKDQGGTAEQLCAAEAGAAGSGPARARPVIARQHACRCMPGDACVWAGPIPPCRLMPGAGALHLGVCRHLPARVCAHGQGLPRRHHPAPAVPYRPHLRHRLRCARPHRPARFCLLWRPACCGGHTYACSRLLCRPPGPAPAQASPPSRR